MLLYFNFFSFRVWGWMLGQDVMIPKKKKSEESEKKKKSEDIINVNLAMLNDANKSNTS